MNGYNEQITDQQLSKLRQIFPEVFGEGKVDWARLKATLGDAIDGTDSYGLHWKGKSGVFAKIQEKTVETLRPDRDNSVDWDTTGNMFIEGDNLAALKILHKSYYGRVKMIYIDPPYNTGNDFVYNDDFKQTRKSYEAEAGLTDDEGNITRDDGLRANTGGHKHSNWLNMMYPRLFLARNLLRQDGVIFVSIDDNEVHNLRLMMNEIFGEENFVAQIIWQKKYTQSNDTKNISYTHEYIVCYARSINEKGSILNRLPRTDQQNSRYTNPDNDPRGPWKAIPLHARSGNEPQQIVFSNGRTWTPPKGTFNRFKQDKVSQLESDNRIYFGKNNRGTPVFKRFLSEVGDVVPVSLWKHDEIGSTDKARQEVKQLIPENVFDTPKPTGLIKRICQIGAGVRNDDIVLDFFSGSGTTAHAVMQLNAEDGGNRQWICVQLPEQTSEKSEAFKAGYADIADIARERIRRAGAKIRTDFADKFTEREKSLDLGFRSYALGESNFKPWNEMVTDPKEIRQQMLDIIDPIEPDATDESILTELLLKRGISPMIEVEDRGAYLFVPSASLAIRLAPDLTESEFSEILASGAQTVLLLSRALGANETLRMNLTLQAEQRGVRVEVV